MARDLTWVFELQDQMSDPAEKIAKAIDRVTASLHGASSALDAYSASAARARGNTATLQSQMSAAARVASSFSAAFNGFNAGISNVGGNTGKAAVKGKDPLKVQKDVTEAIKETGRVLSAEEAKKLNIESRSINAQTRHLNAVNRLNSSRLSANSTVDRAARQAEAAANKAIDAQYRQNHAQSRLDWERVQESDRARRVQQRLEERAAAERRRIARSEWDAIYNKKALPTSSSGRGAFSGLMADAFHTFGTIRSLYHGLQSTLSVPLTIGKFAIDSAGFKETAIATLDTVLSKEDMTRFGPAENVYHELTALAEKLRMPVQDIEKSTVSFLSAGFGLSEVPLALQAFTDLASVTNTSPGETFGRLNLAFSQIKGKKKLEAQDLRQVIEQSAQGGVGIQAIYDSIAKNAGLTPDALQDKLDAGGVVESQLAIYSIVDAVRTRLGGEEQKLGSITQKLGNTLPRLMAMLQNRPFMLFRDIGDTKGMESFRSTLENLVDLTSSETEEGRKLKTTIESITGGILENVFGGLAGEDGKKRINEIITGLFDGIKTLKTVFEPVVAVLVKAFNIVAPPVYLIFKSLINLLPILAAIADGFVTVFGWVTTALTPLLYALEIMTGVAGQSNAVVILVKWMTIGLIVVLGVLTAISTVMMAVLAMLAGVAILTMPAWLMWLGIAAAIMTVVVALEWVYKKIQAIGGLSQVLANAKSYWFGNGDLEVTGLPDSKKWEANYQPILSTDEQNSSGLDAYDKFYASGEHSAQGYVDGMHNMEGPIDATGVALGSTAWESLADYNEEKSPSKLFMRSGQYAAQGYSLGLESGQGDVVNAASGLMMSPLPSTAQGLASGKAGGSPITVQIMMKEGVSNAKEFVEQLRKELPGALQDIMEGLALEAGA